MLHPFSKVQHSVNHNISRPLFQKSAAVRAVQSVRGLTCVSYFG